MTPVPSAIPTLLLRPAAERFHTRLDWLDSWHTFSFASHQDPAWMGFGPLRVINDDTLAPGMGFGMHPHRDMEIVTVMVEGQINHLDSMGHRAVLRAGEVQRMSAGTGILHSEINEGACPCRLLQIWIEPSRPGLPPDYGQKAFRLAEGWTTLIHPGGVEGALAIHSPVGLRRARAKGGATLPVQLGEGERAWIQLIDGAGTLSLCAEHGEVSLQRGDGLGVIGGSPQGSAGAFICGSQGADLLLFVFSPEG